MRKTFLWVFALSTLLPAFVLAWVRCVWRMSGEMERDIRGAFKNQAREHVVFEVRDPQR